MDDQFESSHRLTPLHAFLSAEDLDDLLHARDQIESMAPEDVERVRAVVRDWTDRQAVSNLLFYPELIPADLRLDALDRAVRSSGMPYFQLAGTIGLQRLDMQDVPDGVRTTFATALLRLLRSEWAPLAARASTTLFEWAQRDTTDGLLVQMLAAYPMPSEAATQNVTAAVLRRCRDLSPDEFAQRLSNWNVRETTKLAMRSSHQAYREVPARNSFRASLMTSPTFSYIPNLSEVS